jgi:hypothetical protein
VILFQFIFCADVISSVIFYVTLKKADKQTIHHDESIPLNG